jgi:hypothetical protein
MKIKTLITILILVLVVLILAGSGTKKKPISDEELSKALIGMWINSENVGRYPKIAINADKTWGRYTTINSDKPYGYGEYIIMDKWIDSKGNIFIGWEWKCLAHKNSGYELVKISDSGNTMEILDVKGDHKIEDWDTDNVRYTYKIYYRQE